MAPDIPPELKCMVLENLHDDKRTLSACSVLAQAWQQPARTILFRSVSLRAEHMPTKPHHHFHRAQVPDYESFLDALPASLLHAVHDLEISGKAFPSTREELEDLEEFYGYDEDDEDEADEQDEFYQPPERDISWTTLELHVLMRIIKVLPRLKNLSLSTIVIKFTSIPNMSLLVLQKISLHDFATRGDGDILRFFDALGADEVTLDVFHILAGDDDDQAVTPVYAPAGLALARSLDIYGGEDALRVLQAVQKKPPPLTSLVVHVQTPDELNELYRLLVSVAPSLSRFYLDTYHAFSVAKPFVDLHGDILIALMAWNLSFLKCLTHFKLGVRLGYPGAGTQEILLLVTTVLASLPPSTSHITLHFDFPFFLPEFVAGQSWSVLEQGLRGLQGLQSLQLTITHSLDGDRHEISDNHQEAVEAALRAEFASIKDALTISFSPPIG